MQAAQRPTDDERRATGDAFIGRVSELQQLDAFTLRCRTGHAGALLIESEAGGGKTRLLREVRRQLPPGTVVWSAGGDPNDPRPLRCLTDALDCRRTSPHVERARIAELLAGMRSVAGDTTDAAAPTAAAHELIVDLIEREAMAHPVLLVVDDLQWADAATLAMLNAVVRRLRGLPVGVLGASRPSPVVQRTFAGCDAPVLHLEPFNDDELAAFAETVTGARPTEAELPALRQVQSNPFLLGLALAPGGPSDAITTRSPKLAMRRMTAALDPNLRTFLDVAAVAGRELDVDLVAEVTGLRVASAVAHARAAVSAGWLFDTGGVIHFRHDLLREGLIDLLTDQRLAELHVALGRTLAALGHAPTRAAHHLNLGADLLDPADLIGVLTVVEAHSLDAEVALVLLRRLCAIVEPTTRSSRAMHIELVRRLAARQHHDEAVAVAGALIDQATVEPGRRDAMHALRLLSARSLMALQYRDRALTVLTEGLDEPDISDGQRAALQTTLAELHWFVRDTEAVLRHAGSALDLAAADPDPGARIDALCILSSAASLVGDVDLALAHADEAATLLTSYPSARGAGTDPVGRRAWTVGLAQGTALVGAGRFDDGLAILAPSLRQVEREGDMVATVLHQVVMQGSRLHIGEWDGFVADADAMSEFARETGHRAGIVFPTVLGALVAMRRGDHPLARELMARAAAEMTRGDGHPAAPVGLLLAEVVRAELDREHARAATLASQLVQLLEPVGYTTQLLVALDAARLAWIVSDRPTLDLVAACTARGAARSGTPTRRAIAQYCDALAGGQAQLLAAAAHAMDSTQRSWDAAVAFHIAGLAAKADDMTTAAPAEALLDKASDRYAALGCSGLAMAARRGEAMLRPDGAPSPSAASVLIAGTPGRDARLSGAERRVLELVAAGRSNAEIAGDLFVTKRTVESHLSALYRKLGISTRVALGAAVVARP